MLQLTGPVTQSTAAVRRSQPGRNGAPRAVLGQQLRDLPVQSAVLFLQSFDVIARRFSVRSVRRCGRELREQNASGGR